MKMFDGKTLLITGGTGSFGHFYIKEALENTSLSKIIIYSRDEMKQWKMQEKFNHDKRLRFFIGDVRDKDRLYRALNDVDYVIHAAALKIVSSAEYNPFECVKTNIVGAMNVIDCCIDREVKNVVALSTDKACSPANLYGATKLASDKLFVSGNFYVGSKSTKFSVVRYGNVMGSRGSVIPYFLRIKDLNFPVTDDRMTRFMINLKQACVFVNDAFNQMSGGEIFVKKIPSINIIDIVKAVCSKPKINIVGLRPGEKLHEKMITFEDAPYTYEFDDFYVIYPSVPEWNETFKKIGGKKVKDNFEYSSNNNSEWMDSKDLKLWISDNKNTFVDI